MLLKAGLVEQLIKYQHREEERDVTSMKLRIYEEQISNVDYHLIKRNPSIQARIT